MPANFRLADLMLDRGISNKSEFARETGLARWGLLNMLQNEPTSISYSTLEKLCRVLDCLPNDLIQIVDEDGTPFVPRVMTKYKHVHRKVLIGRIAAKMSPERKMALVKALIK